MKYIAWPLAGLLLALMIGAYIDSLAHAEIAWLVKTIVTVAGLSVIAILATGLIAGGLLAYERLRMLRAARKLAEREADVMIVTGARDEQIFVRDLSSRASWRPAHLDARTYANGSPTMPGLAELAAWQFYHTPKVVTGSGPAVLLAPVVQVDLLAALDAVQRCLIVGASDAGKTTLLQWLVSRRLNTSKVVVIDPHSYPGKYPAGAAVIGQGRNYPEIEQALAALVKLMTKRYDEIGRGTVAEMHHSRITILIDEWRAITANLGKPAGEAIKALLTESRKAAFSVFVASHSDRAKPLGLEGEYDLKDGFALVRLTNVDGQRQATLDTGSGELPALLPGPFVAAPPKVVEHDALFLDMEPEPSPAEAHVLRLHREGRSYRDISTEVWQQHGKFYNEKIEDILARYGEK